MLAIALMSLILSEPPKGVSAVVGEYVAGTTPSSAVVLRIHPNDEFTYRAGIDSDGAASASDDGTGVEYHGHWKWEAGAIHLAPVYDEEREDFPKMPAVWVPIPWSGRLYLVPQGRLLDFCNAVNLGREPRDQRGGALPLRRGDWRLPVAGRPSLPQEWREFILAEPLSGWVAQIGDDGYGRVWIDQPAALQAGMVLVAYDDKGQARRRCHLKVLCPCEGFAKVQIIYPDASDSSRSNDDRLALADRVTTSDRLPPTSAPPRLAFLQEMEPLPGGFDRPLPTLSKETLARVRLAWEALGPRLQDAVTAKSLADISRWAKTQTQRATLPPHWPAKLTLKPSGCDASGQRIRFSHPVEQGVELPSHQPLVRRRVVITTVFNLPTQRIETVTVTIRGWVEE